MDKRPTDEQLRELMAAHQNRDAQVFVRLANRHIAAIVEELRELRPRDSKGYELFHPDRTRCYDCGASVSVTKLGRLRLHRIQAGPKQMIACPGSQKTYKEAKTK